MNTSNLLLGDWRCRVENVDDPDKLMRVQVRVIGLWDALLPEQLPWAEYQLPVGSRVNDGNFRPVEEGDMVWCRFDRGDSRYPLIVASAFTAPDGVPNMPVEAFAGEGCYQHKRTAKQPKPEPAKYHKDIIFTQFGVMTEQTKDGAHRVTHKPTGTAMEITKDGDVVIHVEGDSYHSATGNHTGEITKNVTINVGGNAKIEVGGTVDLDAGGKVTVDAPTIHFNDGAGNVTGAHICALTGLPHSHCSSTVFSGE